MSLFLETPISKTRGQTRRTFDLYYSKHAVGTRPTPPNVYAAADEQKVFAVPLKSRGAALYFYFRRYDEIRRIITFII